MKIERVGKKVRITEEVPHELNPLFKQVLGFDLNSGGSRTGAKAFHKNIEGIFTSLDGERRGKARAIADEWVFSASLKPGLWEDVSFETEDTEQVKLAYPSRAAEIDGLFQTGGKGRGQKLVLETKGGRPYVKLEGKVTDRRETLNELISMFGQVPLNFGTLDVEEALISIKERLKGEFDYASNEMLTGIDHSPGEGYTDKEMARVAPGYQGCDLLGYYPTDEEVAAAIGRTEQKPVWTGSMKSIHDFGQLINSLPGGADIFFNRLPGFDRQGEMVKLLNKFVRINGRKVKAVNLGLYNEIPVQLEGDSFFLEYRDGMEVTLASESRARWRHLTILDLAELIENARGEELIAGFNYKGQTEVAEGLLSRVKDVVHEVTYVYPRALLHSFTALHVFHPTDPSRVGDFVSEKVELGAVPESPWYPLLFPD